MLLERSHRFRLRRTQFARRALATVMRLRNDAATPNAAPGVGVQTAMQDVAPAAQLEEHRAGLDIRVAQPTLQRADADAVIRATTSTSPAPSPATDTANSAPCPVKRTCSRCRTSRHSAPRPVAARSSAARSHRPASRPHAPDRAQMRPGCPHLPSSRPIPGATTSRRGSSRPQSGAVIEQDNPGVCRTIHEHLCDSFGPRGASRGSRGSWQKVRTLAGARIRFAS